MRVQKENTNPLTMHNKTGLVKHATVEHNLDEYDIHPLNDGLNRRAFLKAGVNASLITGLMACKPSAPKPEITVNAKETAGILNKPKLPLFSQAQLKTLDAVQMQLFPNDANGPSAQDLNAIGYLQFAMTDEKNITDGDPEFIKKGIGWLDDLSESTQGDTFVKLNNEQQDKILKKISRSSAGKSWLSLLLYYLTEALTLDPIYGGNPNQIGWQWLEHQPGYPLPIATKTYRDF